ncbi:hypothetical protein, partial [Archangium sp.]|uniref:hypothetical protein n=1 Tax=Archangium sp. TaxID=1872627 RepID=UPI00389ABD16
KVRLLHMLLALSPTLWVASVLVMFNEWRDSRTPGSGLGARRGEAGAAVFLAALMFLSPMIIPFLIAQSSGLAILRRAEVLISVPGFPIKLLTLNLLGVAAVLMHTWGMFGVHLQLSVQFHPSPTRLEQPEEERLAEDVRRYQQLRSRLERLLGLCAANIGLFILVTGSLRNLLHETAPGPPELLPAGSVVVFGVYYTWLLAIIYLPIRKTLNDVGQTLAEELARQSVESRFTWKQWFEERQAIRIGLGLQGSSLQDLQQGLSVLTPLLAGISSLAFGSGG